MGLWKHLDQTNQRCGHTFLIESSPWIDSFQSEEPLLELYNPDLIHYIISTEDDVVEILATSVEVTDLGDTASDVPRVGKSIVLYNSTDREQIEKVFEEIVENQKISIDKVDN